MQSTAEATIIRRRGTNSIKLKRMLIQNSVDIVHDGPLKDHPD